MLPGPLPLWHARAAIVHVLQHGAGHAGDTATHAAYSQMHAGCCLMIDADGGGTCGPIPHVFGGQR